MGKYLREGLVAGAAGGLAAAIYLVLVVEPILADAIALEDAKSGGHAHDEMFSRAVQTAGGAVGTIFYGALLGVILALVVAIVRHRLVGDDRQRSLRVAAVGFVSVLLVPFLKYPSNPPGVGDPSTVGRRSALYLFFLAVSVLAAWSGWRLARTLTARGSAPDLATIAGVASYLVAVAVAAVAFPGSGNDVSLPVDLVWRFRITSILGSGLLVGVTGFVLGHRLVRSAGRDLEVATHA